MANMNMPLESSFDIFQPVFNLAIGPIGQKIKILKTGGP
jgi:hypothetical protein